MTDSDTRQSQLKEGTWWSSWLTTAKEKSVSALNATKRDLAEFVSVISTDTKAAVSGASANIKDVLQKPGSERRPQDAAVTSLQKETHPAEVPTAPYDRCQAQFFALQKNTDTYLTDPKGDAKAFTEWKSGFNVQAQQSAISNLLVTCTHVRTLHAQLVPAKVSYELFWQRYFYKVQLLQQEEERRAELMARARPREETLQWDEDIEEVGSGTVSVSKSGSDHHRSESSDSFVCVSEEPSVVERHRETDLESWEETPPVEGQEEVDLEGWEAVGGEPGEKESDAESSSDWENWDD